MQAIKLIKSKPSSSPVQPIPSPVYKHVRIIKSENNRDGYILRDIESGKIGFIVHPADWEKIAAGQIWNAKLLTWGTDYFKAQLVEQLNTSTKS